MLKTLLRIFALLALTALACSALSPNPPASHAQSDGQALITCYAQVPLGYFVDVLRGPSPELYGVKRTMPSEQEMRVFGRDATGDYVQVWVPRVDFAGWMLRAELMLYGACDDLPITTHNLEPDKPPAPPKPISIPDFATAAEFVEDERVFLHNDHAIYALHESDTLRAHMLILDLDTEGLTLTPALVANPGVRTGLVSETAVATGADIAINADFWTNSYVPQNLMVIDGDILTAPTNRATFALSNDGEVFIGYFVEAGGWDASVTAEDGAWIPLQLLNTRCEDDWMCLYTDIYESLPIQAGYDGVRALLSPDLEVLSIEQNFPLDIPEGHFALRTGANTAGARWFREHVEVGDTLDISLPTEPDWQDYQMAIGGGPIFLQDGDYVLECDPDVPEDERICENFDNNFRINHYGRSLQPRMAIGIDRDMHTLIVIMIEGADVFDSLGATQRELAEMMQRMGADDAMEFDGGGSASLWLRQNFVNGFTTRGERYVSNALLFFFDDE